MLYRPVPASAGRLTVTLLVFPGVRLLDVAGPIEVFASANDFGGRYDVRRVSADGKDVITSAGMRVSVDLAVAEADQGLRRAGDPWRSGVGRLDQRRSVAGDHSAAA
jgi:transcriptional regulator GlxA family with amidase domain